MSDDLELVIAAQSGDREAFGPLAQRWFDRCWEVAWRILHDRDLASDVAQDTLLVAWQQLDRLQQPGSFGGWLLRIARNRALDRLARERRAVPVADHHQLEPAVSGDRESRPEEAFAREQEHDLVWAAAAALGERDASLLDLHLRHGLEPGELADELGITPNAAHQAVFRLRRRLGQTVRAWLLWRHREPTCVVLRAELAAAGERPFGADTVRLVRRHVATCEACAEEHDRVAAPAALFSAAPLIAAPALLRSDALAALADAGVPVGDGAHGAANDEGGVGNDEGGASNDGGGQNEAGSGQAGDGGPYRLDQTIVSDPAGPSPEMLLHPVGPGPRAPRPRAAGAGLVATALTLVVVLTIGGLLWLRTDQEPPVGGADEPIATEVDAPVSVTLPTPDPPLTVVTPPDPPPPPAPPPPAPPPPPPVESETPSMPPSPPPVITSLRAMLLGGCRTHSRGGSRYEITWMSDDAETATLTDPAGETTGVAVSGSAERCALGGQVFMLKVVGPGGVATSSVETPNVQVIE